ncbi:arsenosugar biosynthesis radical SAM (seleno)protein ArsS [Thalassoroseus pseudoceratinae]|uniref:arsenosugar biosynthesis radical SAM (seleno)protein ArsS n=1 Tax=Thalassoroseus pseudoceratinae TaxID=2713176 RepID=UPI00141FF82D|nr:arsenosugar biosynthesis radical SAM (seleno)protein ArsS [Thalassoroseus pseudoceratinae]
MTQLSLLRQDHELASTDVQRDVLENRSGQPIFAETLASTGHTPFRATGIDVMQVNVGRVCNQTCRHCHVDAGPDRREAMSREVFEECLRVLRQTDIPTVDITGGAPEMNPHFRWFVAEVRNLDRHVIDRCNLTILLANGYTDLPEFLAEHEVEVVASLPCYLEENTDAQRGSGVFQKSMAALRRLNELGYGLPDGGRTLSLVYNPVGASLPPDQHVLEEAYRRELKTRFGITFTRLFTITNLPISRFLEDLLRRNRFESYMEKLVEAYNPAAVDGVMCRSTLSVDWEGRLYDCDFNQMLELGLTNEQPQNIRDFDLNRLRNRVIATGQHCYGCTAGAGSSCQGSIVN